MLKPASTAIFKLPISESICAAMYAETTKIPVCVMVMVRSLVAEVCLAVAKAIICQCSL